MVAAGDPEGSISLHAVPPNQGILYGVGKSVAAVQSARDIRGRQGDDGGAGGIRGMLGSFGLEEAALLPPRIPCCLDSAGIVGGEVRVVEGEDGLLVAIGSFALKGRESLGRFGLGLVLCGLVWSVGIMLLFLLRGELGGLVGSLCGFSLIPGSWRGMGR